MASSSSWSVTSSCGQSGVNWRSERGQDLRADRLERADAQRPRLAGGERVEVGARRLHARDDPARVTEQELACRRDGHRARAAGPGEQLLADDLLERRDLLADGGLGVAEALRRAAEGALLRDRLERREVAELNAEPLIEFHDR